MLKPRNKRKRNCLDKKSIIIIGWPVGFTYVSMEDAIISDFDKLGIEAEVFEDASRVIKFKNTKDLKLAILAGVVTKATNLYAEDDDVSFEFRDIEFEYTGKLVN